jgi:hypothetical protein
VKVKYHGQAAGPSLGWSRATGRIRHRKEEKGRLGKHAQKTKGGQIAHTLRRRPMVDQTGHPGNTQFDE